MRHVAALKGMVLGLVSLILIGSYACTPLETDEVLSPPGTTTTIIMVRHAERDDGLDPPLNDEGRVRAQALADELADDGVTAIFMPDLIRNRETAQPLIDLVDPAVRLYGSLEIADTKKLANDFVNEVISQHAGGVVLWIGNTGPAIENVQSGNLQEIYARLGGEGNPPTRYESMYRIVLHDDMAPTITMGTYGGPSSLD